VSPLVFDPFRNRLARDIRNSLSRSFLKSLTDKDTASFQLRAAAYLQQQLEPAFVKYIEQRREKYEKAFAAILESESREVLQQASLLWDLQLYFEMHELLEPAWKKAEGQRRRALQGLIRAAGMKVHEEYNNKGAAESMGLKALADLQKYGGELAGFKSLAAVMADLRQIYTAGHGLLQEE
jgi:predicted metal-dependent hydrolase